ncbi:MAG: gliding motility-associated protein GldE [Bacteroidetes bacterium]|nr:gliding motility-associated protein GldE [Bacteroidota bacterium]
MATSEPSSYIEISAFTASLTSSLPLYLIAVLLLLIVSAMMSGSESAFFSLKPHELDALKKENSSKSKLILSMLEKPKDLLAIILVTNNFVNVGIVILLTVVLDDLLPFENTSPIVRFLFEVVGITLLILIFGEVAPKIFANANPKQVVNVMVRPLYIIGKTPPLSWIKLALVNSSYFIQKFTRTNAKINSDELEQALALTRDEDSSEEDHKILEGIVKFGKTEASEIMTPRVEVESVDKEMSLTEIIDSILDAGYSRIPVYEHQPDNIIGILYIKDLLAHTENRDFDWLSMVRKPFFVPENKKINDLLQDFRKMKMHLAVVVDEYGGASGIVTLEDVLEEIVGDITDEFDENEIVFTKLDEDTFVFEGRTSILDFCKVVEVANDRFDQDRGEAETLGGMLTEKAGRILKNNEFVKMANYKFIVESSDKRRVKTIRVTREND